MHASRRTPRTISTLILATAVAVALGALLLGSVPAVAATDTEDAGLSLSVLDAIILGLVEGLTEYLPVSSTGHLLVTNELLGLGGDPATDLALETYAICIQAGAILAVLFLYWGRVRQMIDGLLGRSVEGRHVLIAVVVAFIPTAIIGLSVQDLVRDNLFGMWPIAASWFVGGVVILVLSRIGYLDRPGLDLGSITIRHALIIGSLQTIAMWPGTSRSFTTILAGVFVGLSLKAAVEFSFLLGLLTLSAATGLEALQNGSGLVEQFGVVNPLIGLVVAFVSALLAVKWMVAWLQTKGFEIFAWYRIAIGIAAFAALGTGAL